MTPLIRRCRAVPAQPGVLASDGLSLFPAERVSHAAYARSQAAGAEKESLPYPCGGCGAGAWQLCWSPTGLPASAPCPERLLAVSHG